MNELSDQPAAERLRRESLDWIVRLTSGRVTVEDASALAAWKAQSASHVAAFEDALRLRQKLKVAGRELVDRLARGTNDAAASAEPLPFRPRHPPVARRAFLGGAVAACAAGIMIARPPLGLWPSFAELTADYHTGKGEQRQVQLAAGVSMLLNTQTSLSIVSREDGARVRLISGEANFRADLGQAQRLAVLAGDSEVRATRANFNLRYEDGAACVSCLSGAVQVHRPTGTVQVTDNQQFTFGNAQPDRISSINRVAATDWQHGILVFREMPFHQMVGEINRYRPGKVILADGDLAQRKFNGMFRIGHLDGAIVAIQQLGVRVRQLPGGIVLLG
ncbi:MAG TPA: FecR domain-containing protein [Rhizomicrobium sp.]|jgi:transmembrane sensor